MDKLALDYLDAVDLGAFHTLCVHLGDEFLVYLDNYLVNSREDLLNKTDPPLFESLLHDCVVGVIEHLFGDFKSLFKGISLVVYELADKLGNGDDRMGIVELDRDIVREIVESSKASLVLLYDICE